MDYQQAIAARAEAEARSKAASDTLRAFPSGPMGLTPDAVKFSPEFRAASRAYHLAAHRLRQVNALIARFYKAEERAARAARRAAGSL